MYSLRKISVTTRNPNGSCIYDSDIKFNRFADLVEFMFKDCRAECYGEGSHIFKNETKIGHTQQLSDAFDNLYLKARQSWRDVTLIRFKDAVKEHEEFLHREKENPSD